ncbi:hypothetical protein ACCS42_34845, partial [Rhizobium ruizarguesonis]
SIPAVATPGNHQFNPKARGFCSSLLGLAAASFAMGVASGVLTAFLAYLNQYDVIRMATASQGRVPVGSSPKRITGIVLAFIGLGFFLIGIGTAICGYLLAS